MKLWRQALAIDRGDRHHGGEERELQEKQASVRRAEQAGDAADQEPAVDGAGDQQRADAGDAEHREAPRRISGDAEPSPITDRSREEQRQRHQRAQPGARGQEMERVGNDVDFALAPLCRSRVTRPGQCRRDRGAEQQRRPAQHVGAATTAEAVAHHDQGGQHQAERRSQLPHPAEPRPGQHHADDVLRKHGSERAVAHAACLEHQPECTGQHRCGEARPGELPEGAAKRQRVRRGGPRERGLGHDREEHEDAGQGEDRGEVDGPRQDGHGLHRALLRSAMIIRRRGR